MLYRIFAVVLCCSCLFFLKGCVEPFELPEETQTGKGLLVVDASMNIESGSGSVILSRTQPLKKAEKSTRIGDAYVVLESESGNEFYPRQQWDGRYEFWGLPLEYGVKYRLQVILSDEEEYVSEFVSAVKAPEIDELTWRVERDGVQINLNTHDPENNTRYYRWEYEETYQYNSGAQSFYEYVNGSVIPRAPENQVFTCWRTDRSTNILIGTSAKLGNDVIKAMPIVFQPNGSYQLSNRYSILVKQYAISREEFEYWDLLKKDNESVGSLFDGQPSQVTGNFTSIQNPEEPVLGYFKINSMTEKRIFISANELKEYGFKPPKPSCEKFEPVTADEMMNWRGFVITGLSESGMDPTGPYSVSPAWCADCRTRGGVTNKPAFW